MKVCTRCKTTRITSEFTAHRGMKDGLSCWCKPCCSHWRKANKEIRRKDQALYRKRHPGKVNAATAKRDSKKLQRTPRWLTNLQFSHIEMFYVAAVEMKKSTGVDFEVDHIVPLNGELVSGLHVPWNLQVLTASENSSKGNKL